MTLRGVWLTLEAWADDPPELLLFENVPRIATRGRHLLDQIVALLRSYNYAVAETQHDCGTIGGLAQSRKRFLLVARHQAKVPPFLYEPPKRPLRAVGDILGRMPLPGNAAGSPMHRLPALRWGTWVRLALVEAGSDWRSLNKLRIADGVLTDYAITRAGAFGVCDWKQSAGTVSGESLPTNGALSVADPRPFDADWRAGALGVSNWTEPSGTIAGRSGATNGTFNVADPRPAASPLWHDGQQYGVRRWSDPSAAVTAKAAAGSGAYSVADPRHLGPPKHNDCYRITPWSAAANAVTGAGGAQQAVADPRAGNRRQFDNIYRVIKWDQTSRTVIGATAPADSAMPVADPRCSLNQRDADADYVSGGHYGVVPWTEPAGTISGAACHDNGPFSVADPRPLPDAKDRGVVTIQSLDGTWHRPMTTLELASLQSIVEPEEYLELDGLSDQAWRERIGNAVPPDAATAIANTMGTTLLLAWSGTGFMLSNVPIWVHQIAVGLSVRQNGD